MPVDISLESTSGDGQNVRVQEIDGVRFFRVDNVKHYSFNEHSLDRWEINVNEGPATDCQNFYFVIDTRFNDAASHWVCESAVYLPYLKQLKKEIPSLKVLSKHKKTFKKLFYTFFEIPECDVVYDEDIQENNTTFFPLPITSQNNQNGSEQRLQTLENILKRFYDYFDEFLSKGSPLVDYVILPRQKKENYWPNDRYVSYGNILSYFEKNKEIISSKIVNTDEIEDLQIQLKEVDSGNCIIVTEGAATIINSLFCKNKQILVNGVHMNNLSHSLPAARVLIEVLKKRNELLWFNNEHEIIAHVEGQRQK